MKSHRTAKGTTVLLFAADARSRAFVGACLFRPPIVIHNTIMMDRSHGLATSIRTWWRCRHLLACVEQPLASLTTEKPWNRMPGNPCAQGRRLQAERVRAFGVLAGLAAPRAAQCTSLLQWSPTLVRSFVPSPTLIPCLPCAVCQLNRDLTHPFPSRLPIQPIHLSTYPQTPSSDQGR